MTKDKREIELKVLREDGYEWAAEEIERLEAACRASNERAMQILSDDDEQEKRIAELDQACREKDEQLAFRANGAWPENQTPEGFAELLSAYITDFLPSEAFDIADKDGFFDKWHCQAAIPIVPLFKRIAELEATVERLRTDCERTEWALAKQADKTKAAEAEVERLTRELAQRPTQKYYDDYEIANAKLREALTDIDSCGLHCLHCEQVAAAALRENAERRID